MRELVTVQLGQCGNQIGRQFWQQALAEHAQNCDNERYDAAMSAFFRNVDARVIPPRDLGLGSPISALRARAVLVDMEEGPVAETLRSPIGDHVDVCDVCVRLSIFGASAFSGSLASGEPEPKRFRCRR